ncbi:uncharacterized protein METZ01_LOCUS203295 [marine metagenome]|uniref:General secretion pathway GspH domain-containing protein n=1 Tax=marine metagenome TaxID=408172 RepID=A0A382EKF4_9ZZZZ
MCRFRSMRGFTLLELMMVMAITAILLVIAMPNLSKWKEEHEINGQAQKVYFDMKLAQATAIQSNNNVLVTFDSVKNFYKVHDDTNNNGIEDSKETVKTVNLENNIEFGFNLGLHDVDGNVVTSPIFFGGGNKVIFNSRGQNDSGGSIFLIHMNRVGYTNDRMRSIYLSRITGSVELLKYDLNGRPSPWS